MFEYEVLCFSLQVLAVALTIKPTLWVGGPGLGGSSQTLKGESKCGRSVKAARSVYAIPDLTFQSLLLEMLFVPAAKWIIPLKAFCSSSFGQNEVFTETAAEMGFCCLEFPQGSQSHYLQAVNKPLLHILPRDSLSVLKMLLRGLIVFFLSCRRYTHSCCVFDVFM